MRSPKQQDSICSLNFNGTNNKPFSGSTPLREPGPSDAQKLQWRGQEVQTPPSESLRTKANGAVFSSTFWFPALYALPARNTVVYRVDNLRYILHSGVWMPIFTEYHHRVASSKAILPSEASSFRVTWPVRGPADPVVVCALMCLYCCKVSLLV